MTPSPSLQQVIRSLVERMRRDARVATLGGYAADHLRDGILEWADELEAALAASRDLPQQNLQHELNAWRELGEEMGRVLSFLSREQYEDLFPDWFGPRLFDLQVKAQMLPSAPVAGQEEEKA